MINWEEAIKLNKPLPCGDKICIKGNYILHNVLKSGNYLAHDDAALVSRLAIFVKRQQNSRQFAHPASRFWTTFCRESKIHISCLGPRWTMPFCYFGAQHQHFFRSIRGLDVGCNILPQALRVHSDHFVSQIKNSGLYSFEYEMFIPHYEYYRSWDCNIQGIDLQPSITNSLVSQGDLRMLDAIPDHSVDFFTIAMIIGPSNSASTIIDAAMCFSELYRTSTANAIIYIADFVVTPVIVLLAIEFGFRIFVNNSYSGGIPIGIFLLKKNCMIRESIFSSVINILASQEIILDKKKPIITVNRELLRRS
jgi:hypothetical protein